MYACVLLIWMYIFISVLISSARIIFSTAVLLPMHDAVRITLVHYLDLYIESFSLPTTIVFLCNF